MSEPGKPPDFSNLTENLSQQQAKISALKELVRQSESQHGKNTASAQEKVKNIAQRLSNLKSKTSKKLNRSSSEVSEEYGISNIEEEESMDSSLNVTAPSTSQRARSETPGSEKITLLRKQMELNRVKMAERESKSKEIEQMVTQLKSKFETSQMSLEKSVELGRSMGDLSALSIPALHSQSVSDVSHHSSHSFNLENERIKFLEKRIRVLEGTIREKETMTESDKVQRLEGKVLDLEENLREKESIIEARTKAVSLLSENLTKKKKDVVDSLEDTKQEMFKMQETFLETETTYKDEVERLNQVISEKSDEVENLYEKCEILEKSRYDLTIENSDLKTKLEDVQDYSTKISELNKLNETLQKQISNLESQRYEFISEDEVGESDAVVEKKETQNELLEKIKSLEEQLEQVQENLQEKTIEVNVVNANFNVLQDKYNSLGPKSLFPSDSATDEETQAEITKLKQQLDDANKAAIKTKLKTKQLQKQVDSFKKSDTNQEVAKLTDEIQTLTQRIAELEEDKGTGQWQEWGEESNELETEKIKVLEATCQNQNTAIQLLEEQKIDMTDDLNSVKQELETVRESSEAERKLREIETLMADLEKKLLDVTEEKDSIGEKLTLYINENIELHEKIDKLSKGSSAESIEMVNITAQENEEYQKALGGQKDLGDDAGPEISQELNESLKSLREESSELMSKIELFTIERREVLDKLDAVTIENQVLVSSIESIREEKVALEHENDSLKANVERVEKLLSELQTEKEDLSKKVAELNDHRSKLQEEINKLVKEGLEASPQVSPAKVAVEAASSSTVKSSIDKEACEKLLKQLDNEIQNLNKNKDKQKKLQISKKLSDNAKSVHAMMTNLLVDYFKTLDDCKELRNDLERVKYMMGSVPTTEKDGVELQKIQQKLEETEALLSKRNEMFDELQAKLESANQSEKESSNDDLENFKSQVDSLNEEVKDRDRLNDKLQEMVDLLTSERDHYETEVKNQRSLLGDLRQEFEQLRADVKVNNQHLNEKSSELDKLQREFDMRLKTSTNEVEVLKTLVAEQKQLLIDSYQEHELDINQKIKEINDYQNQVKKMQDELDALKQQNTTNQESYVEDLNKEIMKLKELLKEKSELLEDHKDELLHKQETIDSLNNQIIDLYKTMEENSNKIIEKEDELQYLQEINDSSKEEIRGLHQKVSECNKTISDLRSQLSEREREKQLLQQKTATPAADPKTEQKVKDLEKAVKDLEVKNKEQLDKLKKFAANLKKKQAHCTELEEQLAAVGGSGDVTDASAVNELRARVIQYEEQLNLIKVENSKLNNSLQKSSPSSNDELNELKQQVDRYEAALGEKSQAIEKLQQQLEDAFAKSDVLEENLFDYQAQIQKIETEKMKLADSANVLHEINAELSVVKKERDELNMKLAGNDSKDKSEDKKKMDKLKAAVIQLKHKLADKKKEAEDMSQELEKLKASGVESQHSSQITESQIKELQDMSSKILEETKTAYEHDIGILRQQLAEVEATNRMLYEDQHRKVSLEGQLETFEMINVQLREKIANLEESSASMESEKNALLREKLSLGAELEEKDALIGEKLRETESDNFQLAETIKELTSEREKLLHKLAVLETQFTSCAEQSGQQMVSLESENASIRMQMEQVQADMKKSQSSHEKAMAAKHAEIDEMEADLSSQLQKIETEKKSLQEALEKANDQIVDFQDEIMRMKDNENSLEQARADAERELSWLTLQRDNYTQDQLENEQLRMQIMQSETETENLRTQNENLQENHNVEIIILRQQISDLEAMRSQVSQNQTDDQVMLENENIKLKELLAEKEQELQHKTIQLQMVSTFDEPVQAVQNQFANLGAAPPQQPSLQGGSAEGSGEKLEQAEAEIERLREAAMVANMESDMQASKLQDLITENHKLRGKVIEMQSMMDNLIRTNVELEASLERQKAKSRSTDDDKVEPRAALPPLDTSNSPAPISTSMLFGDSPQPLAASLFDDPFMSVAPQPPTEVFEDFIQPKKAYLCFDDKPTTGTQTNEDWLAMQQEHVIQIQQLQHHIQSLEQRLVEQSLEVDRQTLGYQQRIQLLESTIQQQQHQQQQQPAQPAIVAQYFDAPQAASSNAFPASSFEQSSSMAALEIEDGWGWGGAEASEIQQQPQQPASLLSPRSDLEVRLQEQRDIVERLEQEKLSLNEELTNFRENSKKMMKKLKEYQTKVKELETRAARRSSSLEPSNDMDLVIQEELNSQIQKLEAKLKDFNAEKDKEQQEKDALLKKVEVLSSANDRLIESKERQDSQMDMYQLKIRDLSQKLHSLEEWGDDDEKKEKPEAQSSPAKGSQPEQSKKIDELNALVKDMQVDFDEVQALLEEEKANNKILEERISKMNSAASEESSKDDAIEKLEKLLKESCAKRDSLAQEVQEKDHEIRDLISKIDLLCNESANIKTILDDLSTQIALKTNENQELNQRLQNLATNNDELSRERQLYNDSVEQNFRQYSGDLEQQLQSLHAELQYKTTQIQQLNDKISELSLESDQTQSLIDAVSAKDQEMLTMRTRLQELEQQPPQPDVPLSDDDVQSRFKKLEKLNADLNQEKIQMEHELQVLNDQVIASLEFEDRMKNTVLALDAKDIEIQMLKSSLEKIQSESLTQQPPENMRAEIEKLQHEKEELEMSMKSSIDLLNAQWSQAVEQRGNEVANSWKQHLEMREVEFADIEMSLRSQSGQKTEASAQAPQETSDSDDTITKMRSIMESQEVEIVSLKEQLAIRSAEYASLSARVDPYHQMSTSMSVSPVPAVDSDKVPRSELDLALYMLHQRDMRLEEMTMELVRLLDERDQLQIRLSNSIRQVEEVKRKAHASAEAGSSDISKTTTPEKSPQSNVMFEEDEQLRAKLSELNTVRHMRDKGIQDEREQRFMDNMTMLQRDVANIPQEAAARIVASSSDQGQSPSSVLMNWILGKNPESS